MTDWLTGWQKEEPARHVHDCRFGSAPLLQVRQLGGWLDIHIVLDDLQLIEWEWGELGVFCTDDRQMIE